MSFRVEPNIHNDPWSSSPVGMWTGRLPACPHVHGAGFAWGVDSMSVGVEALFTSALGLQPPWVV
ncbi:hypothetical protein, partial [Azohydromonas sediminis]|uniref:hypothetical protein n=1 Tax=Azohydromonas sediminis TaxID=2259674 RepID=UPI001B3575B1